MQKSTDMKVLLFDMEGAYMKLEGKTIKHTKFGKGVVKTQSEKYITILFPEGEKKFIYPESFIKFLALNDKTAQAKIDKELEGLISEENRKREAERKEEKFLQKIRILKVNPTSQAAFGLIQNNKEDIFENWSVFSGEYLSGASKGNPKPPTKLKMNSACLFTECADEKDEKSRRIIGAFMVSEDFDGKECTDGIIESHPTHRIQLDESEMLKFWDYFPDDKTARWGKTELKYFPNETMENILRDMKAKISDNERQEAIGEFYTYFCYVNKMKETEN